MMATSAGSAKVAAMAVEVMSAAGSRAAIPAVAAVVISAIWRACSTALATAVAAAPMRNTTQGRGGGPIGGGLDGLVQSFERGGLGDVIGSWIGSGSNQQIAPNRLADALGPDTVDELSRETGLSQDDLLQQLAQALPEVINQLTPQGRAPSADEQRNWL